MTGGPKGQLRNIRKSLAAAVFRSRVGPTLFLPRLVCLVWFASFGDRLQDTA